MPTHDCCMTDDGDVVGVSKYSLHSFHPKFVTNEPEQLPGRSEHYSCRQAENRSRLAQPTPVHFLRLVPIPRAVSRLTAPVTAAGLNSCIRVSASAVLLCSYWRAQPMLRESSPDWRSRAAYDLAKRCGAIAPCAPQSAFGTVDTF